MDRFTMLLAELQSSLPYIRFLGILALILILRRTLPRLSSLFHKLPFPPGPPEQGLLSGNLNGLPETYAWHTYMEWGSKYGDILHYRVYNKHTIILNSYEDNVELLDKRSAIYSDRPYMPMMDLMGWLSFDTGFMRYGSAWRGHRRIFQQFFKPEVSAGYQSIQTKKVHTLLHDLLTEPSDFIKHYHKIAAAVIMSIVYAHDVSPKDDYFVQLAETATVQLAENVFPGTSLFYAFPSILRYVPAWFPGAGFKRLALEGRRVAFEMRDVPLQAVQTQIEEGATPNCVAASLLETCHSKEEFEIIAGATVTGYAAGVETTVSSIGLFFQAMLMYPDVQRRAKKEIDGAVGSGRFVTYDDRSSLPYIEALYREVMRWRPMLPLSVSHATTSDDIYKGYYIPKGTAVTSNIWAITRDSNKYPDPDTFNPNRFFDDNGELNDDDVGYVFGFGRRICPGRHLASATVWLVIAAVLQNFDITKKKDVDGKEIPINEGYSNGFVIHPLPFECSIVPRSEEARNAILQTGGKL